eukprot:2526722-Prymnesium_polylepis.1
MRRAARQPRAHKKKRRARVGAPPAGVARVRGAVHGACRTCVTRAACACAPRADSFRRRCRLGPARGPSHHQRPAARLRTRHGCWHAVRRYQTWRPEPAHGLQLLPAASALALACSDSWLPPLSTSGRGRAEADALWQAVRAGVAAARARPREQRG